MELIGAILGLCREMRSTWVSTSIVKASVAVTRARTLVARLRGGLSVITFVVNDSGA
jgi:hypothetical protein